MVSDSANRPEPAKDHERIKFYSFPAEVLNAVVAAADTRANYRAILAVLMALFELWYTSGRWDGRHHNPVKLTSAYLQRRFGLSRKQKTGALQALEKIGLITVDFAPGRKTRG